MIPPHFFYQIHIFFFQQNDCTPSKKKKKKEEKRHPIADLLLCWGVIKQSFNPPKCGKLSEYTDSAHTEVEDPSSRCMKGSDSMTNVCMTQDNFILPALHVE